MTDLIDMKRKKETKKEKETKNLASPCMDSPEYPYGLSISLDNEGLEKLGMTTLPKVGAKLTIEALGVVTSVSSNESQQGEPNRRVEIQLQKLGVEKGSASVKDAIDDGIEDAKD